LVSQPRGATAIFSRSSFAFVGGVGAAVPACAEALAAASPMANVTRMSAHRLTHRLMKTSS
jgi:hypothetical protein